MPKFGAHGPSTHAPALHAAIALASAHTRPHPPQLSALVCVLVSQPFAGFPSQFAKPLVHVPSTHAPPTQLAVAFANEHARPHAPQCAAFDESCASQPFAALLSQSPYPAAQFD